MILFTDRLVALRCPVCGRFSQQSFSLFSFMRGRPLRLNCGCGFNKMTISSVAHKRYLVQIACLACAGIHHTRLDREIFWGSDVYKFLCPENNIEIGYLGREASVQAVIDEGKCHSNSMMNDMGFEDFYDQPEVMLGVLGHLHFLAENENLRCQCGNRQIEVSVFPDKLELHCISCASLLIIYAETPEDLAAVCRTHHIMMHEHGFASIDSTRLSQGR